MNRPSLTSGTLRRVRNPSSSTLLTHTSSPRRYGSVVRTSSICPASQGPSSRKKGRPKWWRRLRSHSRCSVCTPIHSASRNMPSSSYNHKCPRSAPQSRVARSRIARKTGCTSVRALEMTRRTSLVAVCWSSASVRERCKSAYDGADEASAWGRWRGVPHSPQNFIVGRFSCWHQGHVMPEPPSGQVGERSEPWAETTRPRLGWSRTRSKGHLFNGQDVAVRGSHTGRRPLPAVSRVDALTAGPEQGLEPVFWV